MANVHKKMEEKSKKTIVSIIFIIIISILIVICIKEYKLYDYTKELKAQQETYNDEQKECIPVGITTNYIHITRTDENKDPIEGAEWKVTTVNGEEKGTFKTNRQGRGGIVGLDYGEYYIEEVSVPNNYTKKEDKYKVIITAYDSSYTITLTDAEEQK